jgi:hypothetical protein
MNFKLKQIKGESRKKRKEWNCKPYRIVWRSEAFGIKIPPGFHALIIENGAQSFVERKGTYKTFGAAEKACERHARQ